MSWLGKLMALLWPSPSPCPYCGGTMVQATISDPVTGRVLKLPCRYCGEDDA